MNSRGGMIIVTIALLCASVWGVSVLLAVRDPRLQYGVLGVCLALLLILTIKPKYPVDFKLLTFAFFGYFIAGKGFAYLGPVEPVYIGEILFLVSVLCFAYRSNLELNKVLGQSGITNFIMIVFTLSCVRLFIDYKVYGLYAIRDFSMIYYSLFALMGIQLFQKEKCEKAFIALFPIAIAIGLLSNFFTSLGLRNFLPEIVNSFYIPHPDASVPVVCAGIIMFTYKFQQRKSLWSIAIVMAGLISLVTGKSAFLFSFVLMVAFLIVFTKAGYLIKLMVLGFVVAVFAVLLDLSFGLGLVDRFLETDVAGTISDSAGSADVLNETKSTTDWRLSWWRRIYEDTMADNPLLGVGFGGDITSPFVKEYMGVEVDTQKHNYARYPHNFVFTVLGRFGIIGVTLLAVYMVLMLTFLIRFCKRNLKINQQLNIVDLGVTAFILAGFFNSFVQATYEIPYSAITHWWGMGYLIFRYKYRLAENEENQIRGMIKEA